MQDADGVFGGLGHRRVSYPAPPPFYLACFFFREDTETLGSFFFVFSPFITLGLVRHRLKERRYGPSPANNYTSGYGGRRKGFGLFGRSRKHTAGTDMDDNSNALPHHATPDDMRNSYGTDHTHVGSGYGGLSGSKYGDDIPMDRYGNNAYRYEHGGAYR